MRWPRSPRRGRQWHNNRGVASLRLPPLPPAFGSEAQPQSRRPEGEGVGEPHQVFHITRYAASIPRVNRLESIRGDRLIPCRRDDRKDSRRGRSRARLLAILMNCSRSFAARSVSPRFDTCDHPARDTAVCPTSVTTGTPIQNESRLVVWPLYGNVSSPTSIR